MDEIIYSISLFLSYRWSYSEFMIMPIRAEEVEQGRVRAREVVQNEVSL